MCAQKMLNFDAMKYQFGKDDLPGQECKGVMGKKLLLFFNVCSENVKL